MKDPGGAGNQEEAFYASVYQRLVGLMAFLAIAGTVAAWVRDRAPLALSFLAGAMIAILNFHWLKRTVEAMGGRLPARGWGARGVVLRFLLRYLLIASAAYVIFRSTTNTLYGFFAGLLLPVGAILIEAVYETYRTLREGP